MNSGMPFYCGKPKDEHLLCQDWEQVRTHTPYPELQLSDCEDTLLKRLFIEIVIYDIFNHLKC
jgi:hypothetical protein